MLGSLVSPVAGVAAVPLIPPEFHPRGASGGRASVIPMSDLDAGLGPQPEVQRVSESEWIVTNVSTEEEAMRWAFWELPDAELADVTGRGLNTAERVGDNFVLRWNPH
ncbi:hypothetical protein BH09ACT4_BH09ACT4_03900 [soil metagenome]